MKWGAWVLYNIGCGVVGTYAYGRFLDWRRRREMARFQRGLLRVQPPKR